MNDIRISREDLLRENLALRMEIDQLQHDKVDLSHLSGIIYDRKRTEENFKKINDTLLHLGPSFDENINLLTQLCGELTGASFTQYNKIENGILVSRGKWQTPEAFCTPGMPNHNLCREVIFAGGNQVIVVNNLLTSDYGRLNPDIVAHDLSTYIGKAVVSDGQVIGSLCALFRSDVELTLEHEQIFTIITSALGNEESRNLAHNRLLESEDLFRSAFLTSPDSININRLHDGMYVDINEGFTIITGYTAKDVLGKTSVELDIWENPDDRLRLIKGLQDSGYVENLEAVFKVKNGSTKTALMSARIFSFKGEPHILSVTRDISERKKLFEELVQARDRAEEVNILKSRLLANMSHEIRTPLNGILGFAELLKEDVKDTAQKSMAEIIYSSGNRLLHTLNAILDLSVIESQFSKINMKTVGLNRVAKEVSVLFKPSSAKKGIEITFIPAETEIGVQADEELVSKILNNLINNAIKFTHEGGITVKTAIEHKNSKSYGCIHVIDTGIGIKEENHKIIFDEFRQISEGQTRNYDGAGLGLHISKRFAEMMGGDISVASSVETGSTFTLCLALNN